MDQIYERGRTSKLLSILESTYSVFLMQLKSMYEKVVRIWSKNSSILLFIFSSPQPLFGSGKKKKVKEKSFCKTTLPISWRHFSSASALPLFAFSNDATKLNAMPSFAINFWITYLTTYIKEVTKKIHKSFVDILCQLKQDRQSWFFEYVQLHNLLKVVMK